MRADIIRSTFIDYFKKQGHTHVPSSPVIPIADPTLLFINAGMNQFKDVFLGNEQRAYSRACSSQKCIRAGGKHNDLDNVGFTARHHTFFEMLGNFSFGDYFKEDAINFCWELMTKEFALPAEKLWVTVYKDDDEAEQLWKKITTLPSDRIIRLGEKDNFWSMGDTGPCGPCSEMLIDQGESMKCGPNCGIGQCDCDRYLELWNLVFMQFNRSEDGTLSALPRPSIDTGMGLERLSAIMQGVHSNYDTDLLRTVIQNVEQLSGKHYYKDERGTPFRVIADHIRSLTFALADGAYPSNEGRGYVLRKILRRAFRFGLKIGLEQPFLYQLVPAVSDIMGATYPEIGTKAQDVSGIIQNEEIRFQDTLSEGMKRIDEVIVDVKENNRTIISGAEAFRLYDTYGLPLDIIQDTARDERLDIDMPEFETFMKQQRELARAAQKDAMSTHNTDIYDTIKNNLVSDVIFCGYDTEQLETTIAAIIKEGQQVNAASEKDAVEIIVSQTPFYAESGGQVGDTGTISSATAVLNITNTFSPIPGIIVHKATVEKGTIAVNDAVSTEVDHDRRANIRIHHSATHLLHHALRTVIGDHVKQSGSLVTPERLRFDFTHFKGLTDEEMERITLLINRLIREDLQQHTEIMNIDDARKAGAMALFSEKYTENVRVVSFGNVSKELCGGTHVAASGKIGSFSCVSESSVATGVRRIEAVCGAAADRHYLSQEKLIKELSGILRIAPTELPEKIQKLIEERKNIEKKLEQALSQKNVSNVDDLLKEITEVNGIKLLVKNCGESNQKALRVLGDELKNRIPSGIIGLGAQSEGKLIFVVMVTKDLVKQGYKAGDFVKRMAQIAGGGGGGRPDMAQAGAPDTSKLNEALNELTNALANK